MSERFKEMPSVPTSKRVLEPEERGWMLRICKALESISSPSSTHFKVYPITTAGGAVETITFPIVAGGFTYPIPSATDASEFWATLEGSPLDPTTDFTWNSITHVFSLLNMPVGKRVRIGYTS